MPLKFSSQFLEILQLLGMEYAANAGFARWKVSNPYDQMCTSYILGSCHLEYVVSMESDVIV